MSNIESEVPAKNRSSRYIVFGCGGALAICLCLFAALIVRESLVYITPDERGVVLSAFDPNGYRPAPLGPGTHWIAPFAEQVRIYSIARQTYVMAAPSAADQAGQDESIPVRTKDGRQALVSATVVYALDPDKIIDLHVTWQDRYQEDVVRPQARGITRDAFGQYNGVEVSGGKRAEMEQVIFERLGHVFGKNGLVLLKVSMDKVVFP